MKKRVILVLLILFCMGKVMAQNISGVVLDASSEPLPGVAVVVKGTTKGTTTDLNGKFTIPNVQDPANKTIVFSYIGFETVEQVIGSNAGNIKITMKETSKSIKEVVVVGYGVKKKSLVTGAISSVSADDISKTNISRAEEGLQGRTSGVQVVPVSGAPGAGMNIRVRGYGSNGGSNPLYIVDGIKTGDINYLDPANIANMEVLKDAASCAIYGAEGGNGVVIITTKRGQAGKMSITYDFQQSFKSAARLPKLMNTSQYAQFMTEKNADGNSILNAPIDQNYNTDWLDAIFSTGYTTKHHLAFSGGNEKSTYNLSVGYFKNNGIIVGNKDLFERYSASFNSDHHMTKWLKVGNTFDYSHVASRGINENGGEFGGMIGSALQLDPTTPIEYTDPSKIPTFIQGEIAANRNLITKAPSGNYYGISQYVAGEIINPFVSQANNTGKFTGDKLMASMYADMNLFKGFTFTSRFGYELAFNNNHYWTPIFYYDATNKNLAAITHDNNDYYRKWTWENFATYNYKVGGHNFTLLAGFSSEDYLHKNINGQGSPMDFPSDNNAELDYTSHTQDNVTGSPKELKKESLFGRVSYDYMNRYLLEASVRRDGAGLSQVPKQGRWGVFPSVSAGWVMSNEDFFKSDVVSYAKLRGSWGQNGNLASLDESQLFRYNAVITGYSGSQPITYTLSNGTTMQAYEPNVLSNDKLTWETSQQLDLGLDLGFFNDKLRFTADYFVKTTKGMIFTGIPSYSSGNFAPQANGGKIENKGFEFDLSYKNKLGDLNYSVNVNCSPLSNKVTELDPVFGKRVGGASIGTGWPNVTMFEPGYSVWHFYGYKTHGIDPATGNPIFVNAKGQDTKIGDITDADKQDLGSAVPKLTYGGNINLSYKDFDFALNFAGASGNKVVMGWIRTDKLASNRVTYFYDGRWTKPGDKVSKPGANPDAKTYQSDQYVFDGSFLRIQTIQFGYNVPKPILKQLNINNLRLYVSLDNFFTITSYPGLDPQPTIQNNSANNIGIDRGTYPMAKDIMLGASITF